MEVVPGLKAAGQFVKFVANLKAASDRLEAFLDWKEARKDAASAVSPYATSVENFCASSAKSRLGSRAIASTRWASASLLASMWRTTAVGGVL